MNTSASTPPDSLYTRWRSWEGLPYPSIQHPPGSDQGEVLGVDLALVDGDVGAILADYFVGGGPQDSRAMLPNAVAALERAVPSLEDPAHTYFAEALELLRAVADEREGVTDRIIRFTGRLNGRLPAETITWIIENAEYGEPELAIDAIRGAVEQAGLRLSDGELAELEALAQADGVERTMLASLTGSRRRFAMEEAAGRHANAGLRAHTWEYLRLGYRVEEAGPTWVTVSRERYWSRLARPLLWPLHVLLRTGRRRRRDWVRLVVGSDGDVHEASSDGSSLGGPSSDVGPR